MCFPPYRWDAGSPGSGRNRAALGVPAGSVGTHLLVNLAGPRLKRGTLGRLASEVPLHGAAESVVAVVGSELRAVRLSAGARPFFTAGRPRDSAPALLRSRGPHTQAMWLLVDEPPRPGWPRLQDSCLLLPFQAHVWEPGLRSSVGLELRLFGVLICFRLRGLGVVSTCFARFLLSRMLIFLKFFIMIC